MITLQSLTLTTNLSPKNSGISQTPRKSIVLTFFFLSYLFIHLVTSILKLFNIEFCLGNGSYFFYLRSRIEKVFLVRVAFSGIVKKSDCDKTQPCAQWQKNKVIRSWLLLMMFWFLNILLLLHFRVFETSELAHYCWVTYLKLNCEHMFN